MLLFATALAAVSTGPSSTAAAPQRQAQAMVRIVSSAPLRFSEIERDDPKRLRAATARRRDGSVEHLKLVEFE